MKDLMSYEDFIINTDKKWHVHEGTYKNYIRESSRFLFQNKNFSKLLDGQNTEDVLRSIFSSNEAIELIKEMLTFESKTKTSNSWRKLRRSIAVLAKSVGSDDFASDFNGKNAWKNPTPENKRSRKTGKELRQKTVTQKDFDQILTNRRDSEDVESCTLLMIGKYLGARPTEMNRIEILEMKKDEITVFIGGSKKTKKGEYKEYKQRGIDRTLTLKLNSEEMLELSTAIMLSQDLTNLNIKASRERIRRAANNIWPTRKKKFCLYSLRYTMGSNLKKTYNNYANKDILIAGCMGHLSTSSASEYGNIKSGVRTGVPLPSRETMARVEIDTGRKRTYGKARKRQRRTSNKPTLTL